MKHLTIPEEVRPLLKRAFYVTYDAVAGDCPEVENYSRKALSEIILDQVRMFVGGAGNMNFKPEDRAKLDSWMKVNFISDEYRRDLNRAVREVIGS